MKRLAAIIILTLCTPALADPASPPLKIHVAVHDAKTSEVDVFVTHDAPCAELNENKPEHDLKMTACLHGEDLVVEWETHIKASTHHSRSTLRVARGARLELGGDDAPHLILTLP